MLSSRKRISLKILSLFISGLFFLVSCKKELKDSFNFDYDPETVPTVTTDSVVQLISDSGIVRLKIISDKWLIFEQAKDPYSLFPDGFYLEQLDSLRNITATVKADSAWNFTRRRLWQLRGNVVITNALGESFSSQEFFWDEQTQKIYSNKDITINRPNQLLLHARAFESNQQMDNWRMIKPYDTDIHQKEDEDVDD